MEYNEKKRADRLGCISPDRQAFLHIKGKKRFGSQSREHEEKRDGNQNRHSDRTGK